MNNKSGSIILWFTFAVMLGCFLLIVCSICSTHQQAALVQSHPPVYRERISASPKLFVAEVMTSEKQVEETPVREAMEAGLE